MRVIPAVLSSTALSIAGTFSRTRRLYCGLTLHGTGWMVTFRSAWRHLLFAQMASNWLQCRSRNAPQVQKCFPTVKRLSPESYAKAMASAAQGPISTTAMTAATPTQLPVMSIGSRTSPETKAMLPPLHHSRPPQQLAPSLKSPSKKSKWMGFGISKGHVWWAVLAWAVLVIQAFMVRMRLALLLYHLSLPWLSKNLAQKSSMTSSRWMPSDTVVEVCGASHLYYGPASPGLQMSPMIGMRNTGSCA